MKKLLMIGATLALSAGAFAQGVFFSEYLEGSSNNKAIEIYNGSGATIDLANYSVWRISNDGAWPENARDLVAYGDSLDLNLPDGEVFVICNSSAIQEIRALSDLHGTDICYFNGNDPMGLAVTDDGGATWTLVDAIGEPWSAGNDPGAWAVAGIAGATAEHTLLRKNTVTDGNTDWASSAGTDANDSEWIVMEQNFYGNLGTFGGEIVVAPTVTNVEHAPALPNSTQAVTVSADVSDDGVLVAVDLHYSVDGGAAVSLAMTAGAPPAYSGVIPAQADGSAVDYWVTALDDDDQTTTSATGSYSVQDSFVCADIATIRANDADGSPLLLGQTVQVCGVMTVDFNFGTAGPFYITHESGSVAVYGGAIVGSGAVIGDESQVSGEVGFYNGLTELVDNSYVNIVGSPGAPDPVDLTVAGLVAGAEGYEAQLIRLTDVELDPGSTWPAAGSNGTVQLVQGTDTIDMFVDRDTNVDEMAAPAGTFTVIGAVGQYDTSAPYDAGYQIIPRSQDDFTFAGNVPPTIGNIAFAPTVPTSAEAIVVSADLTDDGAVASAAVLYTVDGGGQQSAAMSLVSGDTWSGTIPAQADGSEIVFAVEATDDEAASFTSAETRFLVMDEFVCSDYSIMRDVDVDGVPVNMGQLVSFCGTLTVGLEFGVAGPVYVHGATGDVAVYSGEVYGSGAQIGDEVEVIGVVDFYKRLTEMVDNYWFNIVASGNAVTPEATDLATLNAGGEAWEAKLVQVSGVVIDNPASWPTAGNNGSVTISQDGQTYTLYVDRDTDIDGSPVPTGELTVTGVIGQYDTSAPYDGGYQLLVRSLTDIGPAALDAPAVTIQYAGGTVVLNWEAVPGATDYVVYGSATGFGGWDAGTSTGGATIYAAPAAGKHFYRVAAVN